MAVPNEFYEQIGEEHLKNFSFIGGGSFGDIFRARHQTWGTDVAVKFLNRNASFTREELLNEARAMDKARFNYILRLYGVFVGKMKTDAASVSATMPRLGLVMEYMENGNLFNLMYQVPSMPWALRFRILNEIALGMNFLHNLNPPLLHLDLKPSNILLDGELHVRVSDFGLSKFRRGTTQQCNLSSGEEDTFGGTLEFMPPESFVDFNYKPAPSTDVYSYGILMWSVLSNQEPYHHIHPANMSSLIRMHIPEGQRPRTEDLEKQADQVLKLGNLIQLMRRCWSDKKDQRPSFRDCREETEVVYCCYKWKIRPAVSEVQDILMQKESSSRTEAKVPSGLSSKGASLAPRRTEDYRAFSPTYGLEEHFQTLHLDEMSSVQNEALPPQVILRKKPSGTFHRSQSMSNRNKAEMTEQENPHASEVQTPQRSSFRGNRQRPRSDTFASPLYANYPAYLHYPPKAERTEQENPHASEVQIPQRSSLRGNRQRPRSDTFASPSYPNNPAHLHYPLKAERTEQENPHASEVQTRQRSSLRGNRQRPRSDTFASPSYPNNPAHLHYPLPFYSSHHGDIGFAQQNQSFLWHSAPPVSYGGVQIRGNSITGVQIGGGNHMHVEQASRRSSNQ